MGTTHTASEAGEALAALLLVALVEGENRPTAVTHLRWGEGLKYRPEGFDTEAEYLAAVRRTAPLRTRGNERNSWRRWMPYIGLVEATLEAKDRSWRGTGAARRRRARQVAAASWYGTPNIILGQ
jgi:hypothetical protein